MTGWDLQPLAGGHSGETFVSGAGADAVVVRIYAGRSAARGPLAPELDAAVLRLMRGVVPVPAVLEVRRGSADGGDDRPGLLVVERLPGVRADLVLPTLDPAGRRRLGEALGGVAHRLAHVPTLRAGRLTPPDLVVQPWGPAEADPTAYVESRVAELTAWPPRLLDGLRHLAEAAADLLAGVDRTCLVHGDLNPKNLLVDPATLAVTGVVDWEFAHAGSPYADAGNLLRFDTDPAFAAGVLSRWGDPELGRAADLVALVDLAARGHADADALLRRRVAGLDGPDGRA